MIIGLSLHQLMHRQLNLLIPGNYSTALIGVQVNEVLLGDFFLLILLLFLFCYHL